MSSPPSPRVLGAGVVAWIRDLVAVAAATVATTAVVFRVWEGPWRVPLIGSSDGLAQLADMKMIVDTGWYTGTKQLGAPFGLLTYDFPRGGENFHYVLIKALSWFVRDPVLLQNLYFLGGFTLAALAAFIVLRLLGARRIVAGALAIVFAFAP